MTEERESEQDSISYLVFTRTVPEWRADTSFFLTCQIPSMKVSGRSPWVSWRYCTYVLSERWKLTWSDNNRQDNTQNQYYIIFQGILISLKSNANIDSDETIHHRYVLLSLYVWLPYNEIVDDDQLSQWRPRRQLSRKRRRTIDDGMRLECDTSLQIRYGNEMKIYKENAIHTLTIANQEELYWLSRSCRSLWSKIEIFRERSISVCNKRETLSDWGKKNKSKKKRRKYDYARMLKRSWTDERPKTTGRTTERDYR